MASIFTYDPEPKRVSSPWLTPADSTPGTPREASKSATSSPALLADYGVTKLEAEPQEGPTEYKLHLLLRPRRTYSSSTTASGTGRAATPILAPSNQSRQNRLQQLTTQLLWRLQQSSPYHASATSDLVLPKLPEAASQLDVSSKPGRLLPGLEESRGALYEIGVSDDGTFVGLTKDEMDESLTNLRSMAASLGCIVEVTRMVQVGDCEWQEKCGNEEKKGWEQLENSPKPAPKALRRQAQLFVAEALITPDLTSASYSQVHTTPVTPVVESSGYQSPYRLSAARTNNSSTEQLRITLTGATTSGKSSLLGTLTTAMLDNGRGKSRQVLLKHRHELLSGVTSSVVQELVGYTKSSETPEHLADVINFACGNVNDWNDIHSSSKDGRLVFISDSAGHPKYRRTTVRGLVGWAPHWIVLCVAADSGEAVAGKDGSTSTAQEILGVTGAGLDLAKAHLDLCLKLEKPMCIVITKLDLASKTSLRQNLSKVLTVIKAAGRVPALISPDQDAILFETDLASIPNAKADPVRKVIGSLNLDNLVDVVPIIITSAVKGTGIRALHALLRLLPLPPPPTSQDLVGPVLNPEQPACLFHVEDIFALPASYLMETSKGEKKDAGTVVAGYMRFGRLSVGDDIVLGPFPGEFDDESSFSRNGARNSPTGRQTTSGLEPNSFSESISHPSASELARAASQNAMAASVTKNEWYNARIVSIRNLRLPVHRLEAGQVGTIGIVIDVPEQEVSNGPFERLPLPTPQIRKGMVLAIPSHHMVETNHSLQAASGFTASFDDSDVTSLTLKSYVVVYIASIRATARVVRIATHVPQIENLDLDPEDSDDVFGLDDSNKEENVMEPPLFGKDGTTDVTLEIMYCREWIELGSQVLIMPGGGQGLYYGSERGEKGIAGLEGFVGKVTVITD